MRRLPWILCWWGLAAVASFGGTTPSIIRVRILHTGKPFTLSCTGPFEFKSLQAGKGQSGNKAFKVVMKGRTFYIGTYPFTSDVVCTPGHAADYMIINHRRYRGSILVEPADRGHINVIEQLPLEEYLYGVLPREVGGDWPADALKSQAVVSRTYAVANLATDPGQRYDVSNDVTYQVYGGLEAEVPAANQAVEATRGEILLTKEGKPLEAFFHSSCGGRTEVPEYVWKAHNTSGQFSTVEDSFCREDPYYHWHLNISASTVRQRLRRAGIRVGEIRQIKIGKKSPSGRAWTFVIQTSFAKREILGNVFRLALGPEVLRSTLLTDLSKTKQGFHMEGRGWGHGVGLCQWGARGRAKAGQTYQEILKAYYPNETLGHVAS